MDFISDGGARGQISFKYLPGTVAPRETSDSAYVRPKLGSPCASSFGTPRFRVIPALSSGSWLRRACCLAFVASNVGPAQQKCKNSAESKE
jgi:hypothetical protein